MWRESIVDVWRQALRYVLSRPQVVTIREDLDGMIDLEHLESQLKAYANRKVDTSQKTYWYLTTRLNS